MSDDLISRQDAINVADAVWSVTGDNNVAKVWDQIKDLPSAQPEIIRCKDCAHADEYYHCDFMTTWNDGEGFCSHAERRVG